MDKVTVSVETTVNHVLRALEDSFPGAVFAVRAEEARGGRRDLQGIDLVWVEGPAREDVEEVVDRFQGVTWDPRTGTIEGRSHFQVAPDGTLQQVFYELDYIFCDGPTKAIFG